MPKSGIAVLTQTVKKICEVLRVWRPTINTVLQAAVGAGTITLSQEATVNAWLDGAQAACDIIRLVSGY